MALPVSISQPPELCVLGLLCAARGPSSGMHGARGARPAARAPHAPGPGVELPRGTVYVLFTTFSCPVSVWLCGVACGISPAGGAVSDTAHRCPVRPQ